MSKVSDTINGWADEVDALDTRLGLSEFEARVMAYIDSVKDSAQAKLEEYIALNSIEPVDPSTTIAWAAIQYAHAMQVIIQVTKEITDLTSAVGHLTSAIANKASQLGE